MNENLPATQKQLDYLRDLGATSVPDGITQAQASAWIGELRERSQALDRGGKLYGIRDTILIEPPALVPLHPRPDLAPPGAKSPPPAPAPAPAPAAPSGSGFTPASEVRPEPRPPAASYRVEEEGERGLAPVFDVPEFQGAEKGYFKDEVAKGVSETIFQPLGIPAKWVVCRVSRNRQTGAVKSISFHPMVAGLRWFADRHHKGIVSCVTKPVGIEEVEGLSAWVEAQNDPRVIFKAEIKTGDRRRATAYGTVRASEIVKGRYTYQPVVTTSPVEMAETRAIGRALRSILPINAVAAEELTPEMVEGREPLAVESGEEKARNALPAGPKHKRGARA